MEETFEELLWECQSDMVRACMEYVEFREEVETVYIYGSKQDNMYSFGFFYKINGKIVERGKSINSAFTNADRPFNMFKEDERQKKALDILGDDLLDIYDAWKKTGREVPTEIKMVYDAKTHGFSVNYNYDPLPEYPDRLYEGEDVWEAEEAAKLGQKIKP